MPRSTEDIASDATRCRGAIHCARSERADTTAARCRSAIHRARSGQSGESDIHCVAQNRKWLRYGYGKWIARFVGFLALFFVLPLWAYAQGELKIHFLDVGQGDGILIQTPSGRNIMVDVGPSSSAKRTIPYLRSLGVERLHLVILTHAHLDHIGAFAKIARAFAIRTYIDPGFPHTSPTYRRVLLALRQAKSRHLHARAGQILDLGGGAQIRILAPALPFLRRTRSDVNSNSVAFRLEYRRLRVLFTGDAERETETRLLQRADLLSSAVLKVAHHGSRHASSLRFLQAVRSRIAVISCGRRNKYKHPHPDTLSRLRKTENRVFTTASHQTLLLKSDGSQVQISARRGGHWQTLHRIVLSGISQDAISSFSREPPAREKPPKHRHETPNEEPSDSPSETPNPLATQPERGDWINPRPLGKESHPRQTPSTGGFVASRRSRIFHRQSCRFAAMIQLKNRVFFRTRQAALQSKRRPASDCRP